MIFRGPGEDIFDLEKEIERYQDEAGTDRSDFASAKAKICRIVAGIKGVRERSEGEGKVPIHPSIEAAKGGERDHRYLKTIYNLEDGGSWG